MSVAACIRNVSEGTNYGFSSVQDGWNAGTFVLLPLCMEYVHAATSQQ